MGLAFGKPWGDVKYNGKFNVCFILFFACCCCSFISIAIAVAVAASQMDGNRNMNYEAFMTFVRSK